MNDTNQDSTPDSVVTPAAKPVVKSPSRRRLIKLGTAGVPVVATLASSPAMAWHCRTASAWGSNMTGNLTKSQQANPAHDGVVDECWAISDWCTNTARSRTGKSGKPWAELKSIRPNIYAELPTKDSRNRPIDYKGKEYTLVTVSGLCGACGIAIPKGCAGGAKVVDVLNNGGDDFSRCIIVAQLNFLFPTSANNMQWCAKNAKGDNQLPLMATGVYRPGGVGETWQKGKIVEYLRNNWMAV